MKTLIGDLGPGQDLRRVGKLSKTPTKLVDSTRTVVSSGDIRSSVWCSWINGFGKAKDMMGEKSAMSCCTYKYRAQDCATSASW